MNWAAYTRTGAEYDTRDALRAIGIEAHVPSIIEVKRTGNDRRARRHDVPALPQVVFVRTAPEGYHRAVSRGDWPPTCLSFPDASWRAYVAPYIARVAAEYDALERRLDAGETLQHYTPGDELLVKLGPLQGQIAKFVETVKHAHALYPAIIAEVEMFGAPHRVEVDPLSVKKAV